jgi:hypothetical protein
MLYQKLDLVDKNDGKLKYMRSLMVFGLPIEVDGRRYSDLLDDQLD